MTGQKSKPISKLLWDYQTQSSNTPSHMDIARKTKYNIPSCLQMFRHNDDGCGNCNLLNAYMRALKWSEMKVQETQTQVHIISWSIVIDIAPVVVGIDLKQKFT